ncbi:MAG TPA: hypothetical protein VEO73_09000 [Gemmatimonadales bacterium]|nr:hypothetical protein [Gemmatimonadales bacterium]
MSGTSGTTRTMTKKAAPTLHTLDGLLAAWRPGQGPIYCPGCGDQRQASVYFFSGGSPWQHKASELGVEYLISEQVHVLCMCRQCNFSYMGCVFKSDDESPIYVLVPTRPGGVVTPHTPTSVAYYLDQAQRAEGLGATAAALPMYRAALDRVLYIAGFKKGTCGQKLKALEEAKEGDAAPDWADRVDADLLDILKRLGDGVIHPDEDEENLNLKAWSEQDAQLLGQVKAAFTLLLHEVYEVKNKREQLKAQLKAALRPKGLREKPES